VTAEILIVDDFKEWRLRLRSFLELIPGFRVVGRFEGARQLMGYSGVVASEHTSGKRIQRGPITNTGNAHLRRIADRGGVGLSTPAFNRAHAYANGKRA
jgi:transposase